MESRSYLDMMCETDEVQMKVETDEVEMFEEIEVLVEEEGYSTPVEGDGYSTPVEVGDTTPVEVGDMSHKIAECKPLLGKEFQTEEEAYHFYNRYSKLSGFSIKRNQSRHSPKTGDLVWRRFSCSKEGFCQAKKDEKAVEEQKRSKYTSRTGCGAKMVISKNGSTNVWSITHFVDEHTHSLISPKKVHFLRSHRRMDENSKKFVEDCNKVGIRPSRAFNYIVEKSGGHSGVGFVKRDVQNVIRDTKKKFVGVDAAEMCQYLNQKIKVDPHSFFLFEMNGDSQLSAAFWADGRSRSDFHAFGDVVCFDTTYKTNKYRMPFAPFVGVNHHGQSVFFGCGLLSDETTDSFVWLFESFFAAMGNRAPKLIITNQDAAIAAAVGIVFPHTRHRYCLWHITQKFPEKLGYYYTTNKDLNSDLKRCIYGHDDISEFEESWHAVLCKYKLQDNQWLQGLYGIREKWVPVYFNDIFSAGMAANQHSESMHAFMDFYMRGSTPLQEFVEQFDRALQSRRNDEVKADYKTKNTKIQHRTALVQLERSLSVRYTIHNFKRLHEELFQSSAYTLSTGEVNESFTLYFVKHPAHTNTVHWVAYFPSENRGNCRCKNWEKSGIVCRHIFCVLRNLGVLQLPDCFILKRLTRNPREGLPLWEATARSSLPGLSTSPAMMALDEVFGKLRAEAVLSEDTCIALTEMLTKQLHQLHISVENTSQNPNSSANPLSQNILDPPIIKTKGYSSGARLKSGKEIQMGKSKGKCGVCHKQGHNRRSCPLLKCSLGRAEDSSVG